MIAPTATVAMSSSSHSGRFSHWMETRSPGSTPSASRAWAVVSTVSQYSAQLISFHTPRSLCRMATAVGSLAARSRTRVATVVVPTVGAVLVALMRRLPGRRG